MDMHTLNLKLKVAIQNHQIMVTKMQTDPQNSSLQKQLHDLQAEIRSLSEKQKQVVTQLRKEIVTKQQGGQGSPTVPIQLQTPTTVPPKANHEVKIPINTPNVAIPLPTNLSLKNNNNDQNKPPVLVLETTSRSSELPALSIRVPQYPPPQIRPSILQTQNKPPAFTPRTNFIAPQPVVLKRPISSDKPSSTTPPPPSPGSIANSITIINNINSNSTTNNYHFKPNRIPSDDRKTEFMAALGLITHKTLTELQSKRSERKRRSTANPQFSYSNFEGGDKKRHMDNYLQGSLPPGLRKPRGRPPKFSPSPENSRPNTPDTTENGTTINGFKNGTSGQEGIVHEDFCAVCHRSGQLLMCDTCNLVYHLQCLEPPLPAIPTGKWSCPKCQSMNKQNSQWSGTLAVVHSYIAHKAAKEDEKRKLLKRSNELKNERTLLENRAKQLNEAITNQMQQRGNLLEINRNTQQSIDRLKNFIKVFQAAS